MKEDFGKRFVTQKELSAEQAFWLRYSNHTFVTPIVSHTPVKVEASRELPKASLVNESLKKLRYQLANFDKVVKNKTTSDAITADKNKLEIQIKQLRIDNDQLLNQIMFQDIMHITMNSVDICEVNKSCVDTCTQSQKKDIVIRKLKEGIKSLNGKENVEKVTKDIDEIETMNIELEHSVAKLLSKNENLRKEREHLKSIFKDQFDSIKKTRVQSKEHYDSLIAQINEKFVANSDLNAQLQEKVFAIATLKKELRKLQGKNIVDSPISKPIATIAPGMFKLDIEPLSHRLKNNRDVHAVYLDKTI
ncbi:hypothetical protein Tco_0379067 [Tanacetum coccineum]